VCVASDRGERKEKREGEGRDWSDNEGLLREIGESGYGQRLISIRLGGR